MLLNVFLSHVLTGNSSGRVGVPTRNPYKNSNNLAGVHHLKPAWR
ncbi:MULTISPECIES: hypothetical protein [Escherichia]